MYTYIYTCLYIYIESPQPVNSMWIGKQRSRTTKYKTFLEYLLHVELIPFLDTALGVRVTCQGYYENPSNIFSFSGVTFHRQPKCGLHCNRRRHQHLNPNWIKFTKNLSVTHTHIQIQTVIYPAETTIDCSRIFNTLFPNIRMTATIGCWTCNISLRPDLEDTHKAWNGRHKYLMLQLSDIQNQIESCSSRFTPFAS